MMATNDESKIKVEVGLRVESNDNPVQSEPRMVNSYSVGNPDNANPSNNNANNQQNSNTNQQANRDNQNTQNQQQNDNQQQNFMHWNENQTQLPWKF